MEARLSEAILIGPAQAAATGIKATIIHPTALSCHNDNSNKLRQMCGRHLIIATTHPSKHV